MTEIDKSRFINHPDLLLPDCLLTDSSLESFPLGEISDNDKRNYEVYQFRPDDNMPRVLAQWLEYRSFSENAGGAEHEGDRARFDDVEATMNKFLKEQTGRNLLIAVGQQDRFLYGAAWIHRLQDNKYDFLLAKAAREYLNKDYGIADVPVERTATFATREYDTALRRGLSVRLGMLSIDKYFEEYDRDSLVVVGRYGEGSNFHSNFMELSDNTNLGLKFRPVIKNIGWIILGATNPNHIVEPDYKQ